MNKPDSKFTGVVALAGGLLLYAPVMGYLAAGNYAGEEAKDLIFVRGVLLGKGIYREMDWMYGPLYPHLMAFFFKVTGLPLEVLTLRYLAVASGCIGFIGAYLIARRFLRPAWSSLAAFMSCTVFLPPSYTYNHHWAAAAALLGLGVLMGQMEFPRRSRVVLLALTTCAALLSKPLPIGVALMGVILVVLLRLGIRGKGAHRLRAPAEFTLVVLALTGAVYSLFFAREGFHRVLERMYPVTVEGENLSFHLVTPFLHPERILQAWGWILEGPWSGAGSLVAFDHVSYTLDFLAVLAGAGAALQLHREGRRGPSRFMAVLALAAYAIDSEVIAFGRELLFSGVRAPAILLLVVLAFRFAGVGYSDSRERHGRRWGRIGVSAALVGITQLRWVLLRAIPMFAALVAPHTAGPLPSRFSAEIDIPGFRGIRVMPETKAHFDAVALEVERRLTAGRTAASWGVPGLVTFLIGDRNILWLGVNNPSPGVLPGLESGARPDDVFLQEILPLSTPGGCGHDLWPRRSELGYRMVDEQCGKVSRTYFSLFAAYERAAP
ncbi:MAG: hypothetical protein HYT87_10055 [Nitrospirae bacterium]|nr:hypothetical protein [Nitrospirota bacterium]